MPPSPPIWIAHRGLSKSAPENTLLAIRQAIRKKVDAVEFDVRGTTDNGIVLMHDDSVDRTTDGVGLVRNMTLRQIRRLDAGKWMGAKFKGQRVPTLAQALRLCKGKVIPVIEIKDVDIADAVAAEIRREAMVADAVVISFDDAAIQRAAAVEHRLSLQLLVSPDPETRLSGREFVLHARGCGATGLDINERYLTASLVHEIKERGLSVWTWTVDDPKRAAQLARFGVDGITTNAGRLRLPKM